MDIPGFSARSNVFGLLWQQWRATVAFTVGAVLAAFAALLLPHAQGSNDAKGAAK